MGNRKRDLDLVGHLYRHKFIYWPNCIYCGDLATERDHVLPLSKASQIDWYDKGMHELYFCVLITVPSCSECNRLSSDDLYLSFFDKRKAIKQKIRKRYEKVLGSPLWSTEELDQLEYALRIKITASQGVTLHIYDRLRYPKGRDKENLTLRLKTINDYKYEEDENELWNKFWAPFRKNKK